jgi:hypothetical protein
MAIISAMRSNSEEEQSEAGLRGHASGFREVGCRRSSSKEECGRPRQGGDVKIRRARHAWQRAEWRPIGYVLGFADIASLS